MRSPIIAAKIQLFLAIILCITALGGSFASTRVAVSAPILISPTSGSILSKIEVALTWSLPEAATQYQLQVEPANGDGPGVNIIRNAENSFTMLAPPE